MKTIAIVTPHIPFSRNRASILMLADTLADKENKVIVFSVAINAAIFLKRARSILGKKNKAKFMCRWHCSLVYPLGVFSFRFLSKYFENVWLWMLIRDLRSEEPEVVVIEAGAPSVLVLRIQLACPSAIICYRINDETDAFRKSAVIQDAHLRALRNPRLDITAPHQRLLGFGVGRVVPPPTMRKILVDQSATKSPFVFSGGIIFPDNVFIKELQYSQICNEHMHFEIFATGYSQSLVSGRFVRSLGIVSTAQFIEYVNMASGFIFYLPEKLSIETYWNSNKMRIFLASGKPIIVNRERRILESIDEDVSNCYGKDQIQQFFGALKVGKRVNRELSAPDDWLEFCGQIVP